MSTIQKLFGLVVGIGVVLGLLGIVDYPLYLDRFVVTFFIAIWMFTAGIHAKGMLERDEIDGFLTWSYAPLVVVVLVLDALFNVLYGSVIFQELPREWLFTNRVKRHLKSSGRSKERAVTWAMRLNYIDPDHVRIAGR